MEISIIIPTFNEEENIGNLVRYLQNIKEIDKVRDIIVVDANSIDNTVAEAEKAGAKVIASMKKGRATQMNAGAEESKGDILFFVHADVLPPQTYITDITSAINDGYAAGCYRFRFNSTRLALQITSYCTRFRGLMFSGGDQTLFIKRDVFRKLGGFNKNCLIMEDFDFILKVRKDHSFKILAKDVLVSDRKYHNNSYLRVNFANLIVFTMFLLGFSQNLMLNTYRKLIKQPKIERY